MKANPLPSQNFLFQCLTYDPLTGKLWWKERPVSTFNSSKKRSAEHNAKVFNSCYAGKEAFTSMSKNGYLRGSINNRNVYAHRVIYKIIHGYDPDDIDHENGNRSDNREINLINKSRSGNMKNRRLSRNNTSGYHGVSYSKTHSLWSASIYQNNKRIHIGWFKFKDDAINARQSAEKKFNYHVNHGRA